MTVSLVRVQGPDKLDNIFAANFKSRKRFFKSQNIFFSGTVLGLKLIISLLFPNNGGITDYLCIIYKYFQSRPTGFRSS